MKSRSVVGPVPTGLGLWARKCPVGTEPTQTVEVFVEDRLSLAVDDACVHPLRGKSTPQ